MSEGRRERLIAEVAMAIDIGVDPFTPAWLNRRAIQEEEAATMRNIVAAILLGYLSAEKGTQGAVMNAYRKKTVT